MTYNRRSVKGSIITPHSISWRRVVQRKDTGTVTCILAITNLISAVYAIMKVGLKSSTPESVYAKNLSRFPLLPARLIQTLSLPNNLVSHMYVDCHSYNLMTKLWNKMSKYATQ